MEVLGVSVDPAEKIRTALEKMEMKVPGPASLTLLSDPDHAVIARYGLLNEQAVANNRYMPHPTTYVLDKAGKVTWKFTEVNYKIRPTNAMILEALKTVQ